MFIAIIAILLILISQPSFSQAPISHQNWQNATVASDAIAVDCASLLLPFELGRLLIENTPTTTRGEMDFSLRSSHAVKVSLQPETGTSDTISNITGCTTNGARIQLATVDTGDSITVAHTPGVIEFAGGGNVVLDSPLKILTLQRKAGIWVSDGGVSGGGGSGGNLEDLSTTCADGQVGVANGSGGVDCGYIIPVRTDCSTIVTLGAMCADSDDGFIYVGDGTTAQRRSIVNVDEDCSTYADIGQICVDSDNGLIFSGDGQEAAPVGGGVTGSSTLDQAFDLGKIIDGANSEGNAMVVGNGTDGFRFYVGTGGPTIECFQGAADCDITLDIPSGKSFKIKYNGTDGITIDSSGNVTLANALIEYKTFWFGAGALSTDSTNCLNPEEKQINGGPKLWTIKCADNNASIIYGSAGMPDRYNGGNLTFQLHSVNENASPSGNLVFDISAMCRANGNNINTAWSTGVTMTSSYSSQYTLVYSGTVTVAPAGSCNAGEQVFWRAVMNESTTTTQVANTYLLGFKVEYPSSDWSDN